MIRRFRWAGAGGPVLLLALPASLLLLATCVPREPPALVPLPGGAAGPAPDIRIGLLVGAAQVELAGDGGLIFLDDNGASRAAGRSGASWVAAPSAAGIRLAGEGPAAVVESGVVTVTPGTPDGLVRVNRRAYRGRIVLARARTGITVINVVDLENYLVSVVGAELGVRAREEVEAVRAQAIVARTFAIRNLGKRAAMGFDLHASVADQLYAGVASENAGARDAVRNTGGAIVTWRGAPIDAFFFSTCAGRTAAGTEVFSGAARPYLAGVADTDGDGLPYCRGSPRYRWSMAWTAEELQATLRRTLPAATGVRVDDLGQVTGVRVARRTGSGRAGRVEVAFSGRTVDVEGAAIRPVLQPPGESVLRSTLFDLREEREGNTLRRLVAEGGGAGHGVGFCQWGAVGRARAGQDAATIVAAYFPGTELARAY